MAQEDSRSNGSLRPVTKLSQRKTCQEFHFAHWPKATRFAKRLFGTLAADKGVLYRWLAIPAWEEVAEQSNRVMPLKD